MFIAHSSTLPPFTSHRHFFNHSPFHVSPLISSSPPPLLLLHALMGFLCSSLLSVPILQLQFPTSLEFIVSQMFSPPFCLSCFHLLILFVLFSSSSLFFASFSALFHCSPHPFVSQPPFSSFLFYFFSFPRYFSPSLPSPLYSSPTFATLLSPLLQSTSFHTFPLLPSLSSSPSLRSTKVLTTPPTSPLCSLLLVCPLTSSISLHSILTLLHSTPSLYCIHFSLSLFPISSPSVSSTPPFPSPKLHPFPPLPLPPPSTSHSTPSFPLLATVRALLSAECWVITVPS